MVSRGQERVRGWAGAATGERHIGRGSSAFGVGRGESVPAIANWGSTGCSGRRVRDHLVPPVGRWPRPRSGPRRGRNPDPASHRDSLVLRPPAGSSASTPAAAAARAFDPRPALSVPCGECCRPNQGPGQKGQNRHSEAQPVRRLARTSSRTATHCPAWRRGISAIRSDRPRSSKRIAACWATRRSCRSGSS